MKWLLRLWAAPYSAIGILLGLTFRRRRLIDGIVLFEGAAWPRRIGWRYYAISLGHTVLAVGEIDRRTLDHELAHVRQYERWGPLFGPAYAGAALLAIVTGHHPYKDNAFERAARAAAEKGSR